MYKKIKLLFGIIFWILFLSLSLSLIFYIKSNFNNWGKQKIRNTTKKKWLSKRIEEFGYLTNPIDVEVVFDNWTWIRPGDKVYLKQKGNLIEMGVVYAIAEEPLTQKCVVYTYIYPEYSRYLGHDTIFTLIEGAISPKWVIKTLLPPSKRKEINRKFKQYIQNHIGDLKKFITPIVIDLLQESYAILEKNFPEVAKTHKKKFSKKLEKFRNQYIEKEIIPLLEKIVWPLIAKRSQKELSPVIKEMWKKFPKFRLFMLWVYQSLPGTDNDHVKKQIEKYLKKEALPILKKHKLKLGKFPVEMLMEIGKDPKVKALIKKTLLHIFNDKELLRMVKVFLIALYKHNKNEIALKIKQKLSEGEIREKFNKVSNQFEPYFISMINMVLVEKNKDVIRPELIKVLRREIFNKDRYYLCVEAKLNEKVFLPPKRFSGRQ